MEKRWSRHGGDFFLKDPPAVEAGAVFWLDLFSELNSNSLADILCWFGPPACWESSFLNSCKEVCLGGGGTLPLSPAQLCRRFPFNLSGAGLSGWDGLLGGWDRDSGLLDLLEDGEDFLDSKDLSESELGLWEFCKFTFWWISWGDPFWIPFWCWARDCGLLGLGSGDWFRLVGGGESGLRE